MGNFYEDALEAIQNTVDGQFEGNIAKASRAWGIDNDNLNKWLKKTRVPSLDKISPILARICEYSFVPDCKGMIRRTGNYAPLEKIEGENLQEVPVYSVAGAGPGVLLDSIEPIFTVFAPPDYFRKSNCAVMVEGHSMEPLIPHGAIVGINRNADFQANELFLAHIPYEGYVIKRVAVDIERQEYVFKSENANKIAYPDFRISINESEKIIVGRVVWIMWGY